MRGRSLAVLDFDWLVVATVLAVIPSVLHNDVDRRDLRRSYLGDRMSW